MKKEGITGRGFGFLRPIATAVAYAAILCAAAAPVDREAAMGAAENFLAKSAVAARILPGREVSDMSPRGSLWIAHLAPSGHVVVAGSTKCPPIVSFSSADYEEPSDDSPRKLLLDAADENAVKREADESIPEHSGWKGEGIVAKLKRLLGGAPSTASETLVGPLMTSRWYQNAPLNDFSPLRRVCGCVATAAAQEIRYWVWPYRMEHTRQVSHHLSHHAPQTIRVNGFVPFDYGSIHDTYSGGMMTANATDHTKWERYSLAYLSLWMQSLANMSYDDGGSGSGMSLRLAMPFFEPGYSLSPSPDNYAAVRAAVISDIKDNATPIQVTVPGHAVVGDGFAVDGDTDWIHLNYGWAKDPVDDWYDMGESCTNENRRILHLEIGFLPKKIAQIDPLPRVADTSVPLSWHIPKYHANNISGFTIDVYRQSSEIGSFKDEFSSSQGIAMSNGFEIKGEKLHGYADADGLYTYPESYIVTESSVLEFDFASKWIVASTVFVDARCEGGDWDVLYEIPLKSYKSFSEKISVPLSAYEGRVVQFRFRLTHEYLGYTYGGTFDIDNLEISNIYSFDNLSYNIQVEASGDETTDYACTVDDLEDGAAYSFVVTPVMADETEAVPNSVCTVVGTPAAAPSIESISVIYDNIEILQDGFYAECGIGVTNEIVVTCSESTTGLAALPSHLTLLPDEKVSIVTNDNVFTVRLDASDIDDEWSGDMLMLTLVASNADGTEACTNMMLRVAKPCQMFDGTFEVIASGEAEKPVNFCGTETVLDAKGNTLTFADGTFISRDNGTVTLRDTVGGGEFFIDGLDDFSGTLRVDSNSSCSLTLAGSIPRTAHIEIPSGVTVELTGAEVDPRVFTGEGELKVVSGTNTFVNFDAGTLPVSLHGGVLIVDPGDETTLPVYGGTLRVRLTDAHVAFGHSTTLSHLAESATVEFVDANGDSVYVEQNDLTFTVPPAANTRIWTPNAATNSYSDESCWLNGILPSNGEYAIFNVTQDATMNFDLPASVALGGLKITGGGRLTIAEADGNENTLSAAKLVNDTELVVQTSRIVDSRLLPLSNVTLEAAAFEGCDVESHLVGTLKTVNGETALTSEFWRGTVIFTGRLANLFENENYWFNPDKAGNANSIVRLNGTSGYFEASSPTFTTPVELVDNGDTPALNWNDGSSSSTATFKKLLGDGTFKTQGWGGNGEKIILNDIADFTGAFNLASKTVAIGNEVTTNATSGLLDINNGYTVSIAPGKIWRINGGVFLDGATAKLDVAGTLVTPTIIALADNAQLVLSDGGLIEFSGIPSESSRVNASLYAGTLRFTADATVADGACFSSTNSTWTTIDAYGNELTFAAGAISGHGTIYPTSTATERGSVTFEDLGFFAGTIIIDGRTDVHLPADMSGSDVTLDLRGGELSFAAGSEGLVSLGDGAKLILSLTAEQMATGYISSNVTMNGGTVEFRDVGGNLLATVTDGPAATAPVSLAETGGYVTAFTSFAFRDTDLGELTEDTLAALFGGSYAGAVNGTPATFCCFAYPNDGVMTCEAQVYDDGMVKGVLLTFTQAGNDVYVVETATAYKTDGTIGDSVAGYVPENESNALDYAIYNLHLAEVAMIGEAGEYALSELFGAITEEGDYAVKADATATLAVTMPTTVGRIVFNVAEGETLTLVPQNLLSAGSFAAHGGGELVIDASALSEGLAAFDAVKLLGGPNLGNIGVTLPDATDKLRFIRLDTGDGIYMKALPLDFRSININFTYYGNLTTEDAVGLIGIPGTMWDNKVGGDGTLSTVRLFDGETSTTYACPGLQVTVSGSRGSYACGNLSAANEIRHGYIDENGDNPTPTVTISGIPFAAYRVIVYHATDTANAKFGYDTINGKNLTYVNGMLAEGTDSWGDAGGDKSALDIQEGVNTLVSGVYSDSTLTVVGHRGGSTERGCIAAIQIVAEAESVTIAEEATYSIDDLFGDVREGPEYVLNVNETATLDVGETTSLSAIHFNIAEGKTLFLTGGTLTASHGIMVNGGGVLETDVNTLSGTITGGGTLRYRADINEEGDYSLAGLFGSVGASSNFAIDVNENATLNIGIEGKKLSSLAFNIAEGKELTLTGGELTVTGGVTLHGKGVLRTSATNALTGTIAGDGTFYFDMEYGTTKPAPKLTGWTAAQWTGTLWVENGTQKTGWSFNDFGNENSTLRLSNIICYLAISGWGSEMSNPTIDLEGVGLVINDGNASTVETVKKLTGSGSISISAGSSYGNGLVIQDASKFTGSISLSNQNRYQVTFGESGAAGTTGKIVVSNDGSATIASGAEWSPVGGMEVSGTLAFAGTGTASGAVTAFSGATLDFSAVSREDSQPPVNGRLALADGVSIILPEGTDLSLPYRLATSGDGSYSNVTCKIGDDDNVTRKVVLAGGVLKVVGEATISEGGEYTLNGLYGTIVDSGVYNLTVDESASLAIAEGTEIGDFSINVSAGETLTLTGETLSAASLSVGGEGSVVVDASERGEGLAAYEVVKLLGGPNLGNVEVTLPDATDELRFIRQEMDGGLYMIALPLDFGNSININFTRGGNNLTTDDAVGLVGVAGTMWDNMAGENGSLSTVRLFDVETSTAYAWPGLQVSVSGSRGSYDCPSLDAANELRHGYIDEDEHNPTPTVEITGIPFDAYCVIVYHATDRDGSQFGYDTINGANLTSSNGILTSGTAAWGNAGEQDTALDIHEGVNTLVSGVYTNSTLTVVAHKDGDARGCIAAIQVVKVDTAQIDEERIYTLDQLFDSVDASSTFAIDVNETATLDVGGVGTLRSLAFNIAEGKTLTLTGGELTVTGGVTLRGKGVLKTSATDALTGSIAGDGTFYFDMENKTAKPALTGWTAAQWTGTLWVKNGKKAGWNFNNFGNENSTLRLSNIECWIAATEILHPTLELEGEGLKITDGGGGIVETIRTLTGSGSISISAGSSYGNGLVIQDASEFTGSISLSNQYRYQVTFGQTGASGANGKIVVSGAATIANGAVWSPVGGMEVSGTLAFAGTGTASGAVTAYAGATLDFSAVLREDSQPPVNGALTLADGVSIILPDGAELPYRLAASGDGSYSSVTVKIGDGEMTGKVALTGGVLKVVGEATISVSSEGDEYTFEELFGDLVAAEGMCTLTIAKSVSILTTDQTNVGDLKVVSENDAKFKLCGSGRVVFSSDPYSNLEFETEGDNKWTGTLVMGWNVANQGFGTSWVLDTYGISGSTVDVAHDIEQGYFKDKEKNGVPSVAPAVYFAGNVTINNGYTGPWTTFSSVGMAEGKTFKTRGSSTKYKFTTLHNFNGTLEVRNSDTVEIDTIVCDAMPSPGEFVARVKVVGTAVLNDNANVGIVVRGREGTIPAMFVTNTVDHVSGFVAKSQSFSVFEIPGTIVAVTADGEPVQGDNGAYAVIDGQNVVVTYTADGAYVVENGTIEFVANDETIATIGTIGGATTATPAVARVGSTYYTILQTAVDAAAVAADDEPGETVVLLANCEENLTLAKGMSVTINANGHTYNAPSVSDGSYTFDAVEESEGVTTYTARDWYEWTVSISEYENATVTGLPVTVMENADTKTITFTVTADDLYRVTGVTVSSGELVAGENGEYTYEVSGDATVTVATERYLVLVTVPEIDGTVVTVTADGEVVEGDNGVYTVGCGKSVVVTYAADGEYVVTGDAIEFDANDDTDLGEDGWTLPVSTPAVALVGFTYYKTLQAAVNAAAVAAGGEPGETVVLLADSVEALTLEKGKTVTINANGHTYNAPSVADGSYTFDAVEDSDGVTAYTGRDWYEWTVSIAEYENATVTGLPVTVMENAESRTIAFTVTAEALYRVTGVTVSSGELVGDENGQYSYEVSGDAVVTVETELYQVTLRVPSVEHASYVVTVDGEAQLGEDGVYTLIYGSKATVTYTADEYYEITENAVQTFDMTGDAAAVAPTVVRSMVAVTVPSVDGAVLTGWESDGGDVTRLEDGTLSVPAGSTLTLTWEVQGAYVLDATTTTASIGTEPVELSGESVAAPAKAVAQDSNGKYYINLLEGIGWLLGNINAEGSYLEFLGEPTGDENVYGGYSVGYDASAKRYAKASAIIAIDGTIVRPGFLTVQEALDEAAVAAEDEYGNTVMLLADCEEALTLAKGKSVKINANERGYSPPVAPEGAYTFDTVEVSGSVVKYTGRDWYEWTVSLVGGDNATVTGLPTNVMENAENKTITFTVTADALYRVTGVTVSSGELVAGENGQYACEVSGDVEVTVATERYLVLVTVPEITGTVVTVTADGEAVEGDNGVYTVGRGKSVVVTYAADGEYVVEGDAIEFAPDVDTDLGEDGWTLPVSTPAVARAGSTYYTTLQAAVDAAAVAAGGEPGETVVLLADSEEILTLEKGKTVTINANGHTYNAPSVADGSYTFDEVEVSDGVTTYTARDWHEWTVVYANWDGEELQRNVVSENAPAMPEYTGAAPTREPTAQYSYSFTGWGDVADVVTDDVTYTARFTATTRCYTVTWLDDGGTVLDVDENVAYGTLPTHAAPVKTLESPYRQDFAGWSPVVEIVTSNATYRATFDEMVADISTLADEWEAKDGDKIVGETEHAVKIPGGATVTINGVRVAGLGGGGSSTAAPEFAENAKSDIISFERTEDGNWSITCYLPIDNDASGTSVANDAVKVYRADSVADLETAEPMDEGVRLTEKKSAVKMTFEVSADDSAPAQFFKVKAQ